jgi:hypothetical protein
LKLVIGIIFILAGIPSYALDKSVRALDNSVHALDNSVHALGSSVHALDTLIHAHSRHNPAIAFEIDSLLPVRNAIGLDEGIRSDLLDVETYYRATGDNRRAFARLLKILSLKRSIRDRRTRARLFNDLAGVSARLKLYPLAMKWYYRAIQSNKTIRRTSLRKLIIAIHETVPPPAGEEHPITGPEVPLTGTEDPLTGTEDPLTEDEDPPAGPEVPRTGDEYPFTGAEDPHAATEEPSAAEEEMADACFSSDSILYRQWLLPDTPLRVQDHAVRSVPVPAEDIWGSFNDGKTASSYALLVHVKQPVPGKRKSFAGINNVGHMFITLIKYNKDNSFVCRSFGFYPDKSGILSATPIQPGSGSVFKNDAMHDWDEVAGKFISFRRFQKIVEVIKSYDQRTYHLSQNNCTDFGLTMAMIGGISIIDTRGSWPLGNGNNPGSTGQSIFEGKLSNIDADYQNPLFICRNIELK